MASNPCLNVCDLILRLQVRPGYGNNVTYNNSWVRLYWDLKFTLGIRANYLISNNETLGFITLLNFFE